MQGNQYDILTLFADGGIMMYPLLLFSLVGFGVMIAKAWTLWIAHRDTDKVLTEVEELARAGRIDEAIEAAASTPGPASAILLSGLRRIQEHTIREGALEQAINTTGTIELGFLERGLVILATVANVAPLTGFLGTVAGMILAFDSIEAAGNVDPALVAGGIKVALLTTAAGLVIAVPVNIAYNFFVTRIDKLVLDMEQGAQQILNLAWDMDKEGKLNVVSAGASLTTAGAARENLDRASTAPDAAQGPRKKGSDVAERDVTDTGL
ncbi:MAG: MotA/TolQ/ExbB proton channel family protein [Longimicrobiales bacterium]|nr:MotA/TolQ/ExbB proton channel family protein [Longimicrobiales bacterium]